MNQTTLHLVFKAMLFTARELGEEGEINKKYLELEELIDTMNDYSLTDMIDNLDNVYNLIDQSKLEF